LSCLSSLSVTLVYCSQTVGWIKMKFDTQEGLRCGHIALYGYPTPPPAKGHSSNFRPYLLWPNGWMDQHATWQKGRPRTKRHCVRRGQRSPFPKKGAEPPILTAGWIMMSLGMEVGLGPGHIVLGGTQLSLLKNGTALPIFGQCLLWPKGSMDQDVTWHGGRPRPRPHCAKWGPSSPKNGGSFSSDFRPMSVVAEQ